MVNYLMDMLKKRIRFSKKKFIVLLSAITCCLAVIATGTIAYFVAEDTAYNVITTDILSLDLEEDTTGGEPWPEEGVTGVLPGEEVDKIPYVTNTGEIDFYLRATITVRVTAADGSALSDEYISMDINHAYWTFKDGYYYYNTIVKPGETTEPLFTKVTFDPQMPNEYMDARIEIEIHVEAVQSQNNGDSPFTAIGWTQIEVMEGDAE